MEPKKLEKLAVCLYVQNGVMRQRRQLFLCVGFRCCSLLLFSINSNLSLDIWRLTLSALANLVCTKHRFRQNFIYILSRFQLQITHVYSTAQLVSTWQSKTKRVHDIRLPASNRIKMK